MAHSDHVPLLTSRLSRRSFLKVGGVALAGSAITGCSQQAKEGKIQAYRTLGRTGFKASDISMGTTRIQEPGVVRYAYDHGVNYFDTAERYVNGKSESIIGEALNEMDRKKVFITSKIHVGEEDTFETVLDRFTKCQERLATEYIDAFYMHGVTKLDMLNHEGFHKAMVQLKADGRLRFVGLSSHGPRNPDGDSMEDVLVTAAEDGRFDLMLLVYSFMNQEAGEKILAACKKNNVGTTAMKVSPGVLKVDPFDPANPTESQSRLIERYKSRGMSEEQIIQRMERRVERQQETHDKTKPFLDSHGIQTEDQLKQASIQWVLNNPDMQTVCVSFSSFEQIDKIIPVSGTTLSAANAQFLKDYEYAYGDQYCRHGCQDCQTACPNGISASTIMRYAYYYEMQGRERFAMEEYAHLSDNADACHGCSGTCQTACPHNVDVQSQLTQAHDRLTLA